MGTRRTDRHDLIVLREQRARAEREKLREQAVHLARERQATQQATATATKTDPSLNGSGAKPGLASRSGPAAAHAETRRRPPGPVLLLLSPAAHRNGAAHSPRVRGVRGAPRRDWRNSPPVVPRATA